MTESRATYTLRFDKKNSVTTYVNVTKVFKKCHFFENVSNSISNIL